MQIYLPIAEMPVNIFGILALGGLGGVLSGMFGIGGGFIMTPMLIFIGIPPPVAVASATSQIIGASVSGFMAHWRRQNVDVKMGLVLLAGGLVGSSFGVWLFKVLKQLGQIDLVISLTYVVFLGFIGSMMLVESLHTIREKKAGTETKDKTPLPPLLGRLPMKMEFPRSELAISALLPLSIGFLAGMLVSLMGIGGGFIMIPAMIYLLGMPTAIVIGTSLFQIIFTTSNVTLLQAVNTQTVDIVLALLLLMGAVIGAQFGTRIGMRLPAEQLRGLLAVIVLAVAMKLAANLFTPPDDLFTITRVTE